MGTARWLARNISSPMPPRPLATARRGAASAAGRRSTWPSVFVNSRLVTGSGAVTLTTPLSSSSWSGPLKSGEKVVEVDPAPPLVAVAEARAQPRLEGGEHLGERPAGAADHDAEARRHDAHAGVGRGRGRRFPGATDVGEVAVAELGELCERLAAARAVGADRRCGDEHPRRRLHLLQRRDERVGRLHAAVQDGLPAARRSTATRCSRPARFTTASTPARSAGSRRPAAGSQLTSSGRGRRRAGPA